MFTYFVKNNINRYIKIGKAVNIHARLKTINGQISFVEIKLLHYIKGDYESYFHSIYKDYRKEGEWFDIPDLTIDEINCHVVGCNAIKEVKLGISIDDLIQDTPLIVFFYSFGYFHQISGLLEKCILKHGKEVTGIKLIEKKGTLYIKKGFQQLRSTPNDMDKLHKLLEIYTEEETLFFEFQGCRNTSDN